MESNLTVFSSLYFDDVEFINKYNAVVIRRGIDVVTIDAIQPDTLQIHVKNGLLYIGDEKFSNIEEVFNKYIVVPKVCATNENLKSYRHKLALIIQERKNIYRSQIALNKGNKWDDLALQELFEPNTGGVYFSDEEWELIDDANPIKKFFTYKQNEVYAYLLEDDSGVILRGAAVYYFHAAFGKVNLFGGHDRIRIWFSNTRIMLKQMKMALGNFAPSAKYSARLLLGLLDNLRNLILIFLNYELLRHKECDSFLLILGENENSLLNNQCALVEKYIRIYEEILFSQNVDLFAMKEDILAIINSLLPNLEYYATAVKNTKSENCLYKCFSPLPRENDNFFENYVTLKYCLSQYGTENIDGKYLMGILSGGLELPFIVQCMLPEDCRVKIGFALQNFGSYFERQGLNLNSATLVMRANLCQSKNNSAIVIDDNVMCGATLQLLINELTYLNYEVEKAWIIRHPDLNRIFQQEYYDHFFNLASLDKFVEGFLVPTRYSKISKDKNYGGYFLDEFGVYSACVNTFLRGLYKNGSFVKNSETDIFNGFSKPMTEDLILQDDT